MNGISQSTTEALNGNLHHIPITQFDAVGKAEALPRQDFVGYGPEALVGENEFAQVFTREQSGQKPGGTVRDFRLSKERLPLPRTKETKY